MNNKGSISLSINALVIIILSVAMLSGGVTLMYQFISGAEDIKTQMDKKTELELERLLINEGQMVALPLHTKVVPRGETHVFGIGILNIGDKNNFILQVELNKAIDEYNKVMTGTNAGSWTFCNDKEIILEKNQNHKESILVNVPKENAPKGKYFFNARVIKGGGQYGNTQSFTVTVP